MRRIIVTLASVLLVCSLSAQKKENAPTVYVDKQGVMRWSDSREEASFFGVNYTVPFAHAYRALDQLGKDHKEAIDRDVYHFARLGFNAYRIHIWDVEISDKEGNLLQNNHLDLFDYLILKLKERDIRIVITTMTNFGNGYPERNINTGAFSYLYSKCNVHHEEEAIRAQENYISQLVKHVNPYTGISYKDDPYIIGIEINNEPCHADTPEQTEKYIRRMIKAVKETGYDKPLFYNVSHNMDHIQAYYNTPIEGTTYQWYPIGLVAGHTRKGNFLPYVDQYPISFSQVKGFDKKAKLVYEYDPADVMYSYIHPAMARSFRSAGFQWITQFAYDPIDMAQYNSEYQTHFLNLAYTPQKALSMKIAAEVAYTIKREEQFPKYPNDTVFGDFRISYAQDMSLLNNEEKYYYSNHTDIKPVNPDRLKSIAGYGNSPLVKYEGTGAYFIDKLDEGLWRLEVMPDAIQSKDPFAKPSLDKEIVSIFWNRWDMVISLPQLTNEFVVYGINKGNTFRTESSGGLIPSIAPGVYLLQTKEYGTSSDWQPDSRWRNINLNEFVTPEDKKDAIVIAHEPVKVVESDSPLLIRAQIAGTTSPDSVKVFTDKVSFWNSNNPSFTMKKVNGYLYETVIPADQIKKGTFKYNIVVSIDGKHQTYPAEVSGTPLSWDYISTDYYETTVVAKESPVYIFTVKDENHKLEAYTMPEWSRTKTELIENSPTEAKTLRFFFESSDENPRFFLHKYIKDEINNRKERLKQSKHLCIHIKNAPTRFDIGFITNKGFTYTSTVENGNGIVKIPLTDLKQTKTALLPHPYPVFLDKYFEPDTSIAFNVEDIEKLEISFGGKKDIESTIELGTIWIE